jgi:hypothetical protein
VALEPSSPGIGLIACDLQRSVNILILQLDAAADDANDAHAHAMDAMHYTCEWGVHSYGNYLSKGLKSLHSSIFWALVSILML